MIQIITFILKIYLANGEYIYNKKICENFGNSTTTPQSRGLTGPI